MAEKSSPLAHRCFRLLSACPNTAGLPIQILKMADPSWSTADVAKALCDALVASGKLRANPAFIREDREAKIASVFEYAVGLPLPRAPAGCPRRSIAPIAMASQAFPQPQTHCPHTAARPSGVAPVARSPEQWQAASSQGVRSAPKARLAARPPGLTTPARCLQSCRPRWREAAELQQSA